MKPKRRWRWQMLRTRRHNKAPIWPEWSPRILGHLLLRHEVPKLVRDRDQAAIEHPVRRAAESEAVTDAV